MEFKSKRLIFVKLSERLREYERKYGYLNLEFYHRFQSGEWGNVDDLIMWNDLAHLAQAKGEYHLWDTQ